MITALYLYTSTVIFFLLFIIWNSSSGLNKLIKGVLLLVFIAGVFTVGLHEGFIIKGF